MSSNRFCTECGAEYRENDKFCGKCGSQRTAPKQSPVSQPKPNQEPEPTKVEPEPYTRTCRETIHQTTSQDSPIPDPPESQVSIEVGSSEVSTIRNLGRAFLNVVRPRNPPVSVSEAVYTKLPDLGAFISIKLILISFALIVGYYYLTTIYLALFNIDYIPFLMDNITYLGLSYAVALIYMIIIYRMDKYEREPFKLVLLMFAWGVFSGIMVGPLNDYLGPIVQDLTGNFALIAPFTEEPLKAIGFYYLITRKRFEKEFNTPLDGIIYGFAVGLGFFAMENFSYVISAPSRGVDPLSEFLTRIILTWVHGAWVATTGLWLGYAKVKRGYTKPSDIIPGLSVAIVFHLIWNGFITLNLILSLVGSVFFIRYTKKILRESLRDEQIWGYTKGLAPNE